MKKRGKGKLLGAELVLQSLFENSKSPLANGFQRWNLEREWSTVVGAQLGNATRPVDYNRGVLFVAVKNSSLLTELIFLREHLIEKVNQHIGRKWVHKLVFKAE